MDITVELNISFRVQVDGNKGNLICLVLLIPFSPVGFVLK